MPVHSSLVFNTRTVDNRQSKVWASLLDAKGKEIPKTDYDLELGYEDFCFRLKNPPVASGGYGDNEGYNQFTVVLGNDAGETRKDIRVKFICESSYAYYSEL